MMATPAAPRTGSGTDQDGAGSPLKRLRKTSSARSNGKTQAANATKLANASTQSQSQISLSKRGSLSDFSRTESAKQRQSTVFGSSNVSRTKTTSTSSSSSSSTQNQRPTNHAYGIETASQPHAAAAAVLSTTTAQSSDKKELAGAVAVAGRHIDSNSARAYLEKHVFPTLLPGIELLLKTIKKKEAAASPEEDAAQNPVAWLAMYLYRNNPNASAQVSAATVTTATTTSAAAGISGAGTFGSVQVGASAPSSRRDPSWAVAGSNRSSLKTAGNSLNGNISTINNGNSSNNGSNNGSTSSINGLNTGLAVATNGQQQGAPLGASTSFTQLHPGQTSPRSIPAGSVSQSSHSLLMTDDARVDADD